MEEAQPVSLGKRLQRERESYHWTQEQFNHQKDIFSTLLSSFQKSDDLRV